MNPDGVGATADDSTATCERPAKRKHATTSASSASVLARLVKRCAKSPRRVPRIKRIVKTTTMDIAIGDAALGARDVTLAIDSPSTSEIAPIDAHVEIQSTHPTRKPV